MSCFIEAKKSIVHKYNHSLNGYFLFVKVGNDKRAYKVLKSDYDKVKSGDTVTLDYNRMCKYAYVV